MHGLFEHSLSWSLSQCTDPMTINLHTTFVFENSVMEKDYHKCLMLTSAVSQWMHLQSKENKNHCFMDIINNQIFDLI